MVGLGVIQVWFRVSFFRDGLGIILSWLKGYVSLVTSFFKVGLVTSGWFRVGLCFF